WEFDFGCGGWRLMLVESLVATTFHLRLRRWRAMVPRPQIASQAATGSGAPLGDATEGKVNVGGAPPSRERKSVPTLVAGFGSRMNPKLVPGLSIQSWITEARTVKLTGWPLPTAPVSVERIRGSKSSPACAPAVGPRLANVAVPSLQACNILWSAMLPPPID